MLILTRRSGQEILVVADCEPPARPADAQRLVKIKIVAVERYVGSDAIERVRIKVGVEADGMDVYRGEVFARYGLEAQTECLEIDPL